MKDQGTDCRKNVEELRWGVEKEEVFKEKMSSGEMCLPQKTH